MLSGDDLSIQLFIAATGITLLGIAVTQAGWTHKQFVRGMFAVGGLFCLIGVLWSPISKAFPRVDLLADIATSAWAWLLLLTGALFTLGWLEIKAREKWSRRIPELLAQLASQIPPQTPPANKFSGLEWPKVSEWKSPIEAIDAFVDQKLHQDFLAKLHVQESAFSELEAAQTAFNKKTSDPVDLINEMNNPSAAGRRRNEAQTKLTDAKDQCASARNAIIEDLRRQLINGNLVARGVPSEKDKLHTEWDFLKPPAWVQLQFATYDSKLETVSGAGRTYKGIQIGQPTPADDKPHRIHI